MRIYDSEKTLEAQDEINDLPPPPTPDEDVDATKKEEDLL